jgi:molybdenum cofactor biosynthesis protein B
VSERTPAHPQHHHRKTAQSSVACAVVTVSDTRTHETDTGGQRVVDLLEEAGHRVVQREIVADEETAIAAIVQGILEAPGVQAAILTGGTGVAPRDVTPEAVTPLLEREIPGFGELFRMLSYEEIGSGALLSRALAGLAAGTVLLVLPGSRGAVQLGMQKLVLPELGHLVAEAQKRT